MILKIYKLVPEPKLRGSFENGILQMNGKEFVMSEDEVKDRFNRGYYRTGEV